MCRFFRAHVLSDSTSSLFTSSQFVINLSNIALSSAQISLLDKGLTFIPTVTRFSYQYILDCKERNIRNVKLRDFFRHQSRDFDVSDFSNLFMPPNTWIPPVRGLSTEAINAISTISTVTNSLCIPCISRHATKGPIIKCSNANSKKNLSTREFQAIRELQNSKSLIIKPADKGGAVVIIDAEAYRAEGLRQLTNSFYYKEIPAPLAPSTVPLINSIVNKLYFEGFINIKQSRFLKASIPASPRAFYLLPKVHKERHKWPSPSMPEGRPIVSDSGSETYNICTFIDHYLRPLATAHLSYVRDTYDFISKIRGQAIPSNCLIVSADVTALYPNMNIARSLQIVADLFKAYPDPNRPDKHLLALLDICLNINDFMFDDRFFIQLCGTAMGKTFAPHLANIYMLKFDEAARNGFHIKPLLYYRFLDDIFFIWPGTREELDAYREFLNNIIDGISITMCVRHQVIEFLDTRIFKKHLPSGCILSTCVYFKPTDTHQLLHGSSAHPRHTTRGILKSQLIRFKRISSSRYEYDYACKTLFDVLSKRGYSRSVFRRLKLKIWASTQYTLLNRTRDKRNTSAIFPIVNYFDPISANIMKATRLAISTLPCLQKTTIVNAFKIHRNLSGFLTRSRFSGKNR